MKKYVLLPLALGFLTFTQSLLAQGTAFTYQGQLQNNGSPAGGHYDFTFALYSANNTSGPQVGGTVTNLDTGVTNGLFAVTLDFGPVFSGNAIWLAIGVRSNGGADFTPLNPLQPLTPDPYAIYAPSAGTAASASSVAGSNIVGTIASAQLPAGVLTNGENGVDVTGTFSGDGGGLTNLSGAQLTGLTDLQQIALLKWWVGSADNTFGVGSEPDAICFDGTSIWVANYGGNNVTKLNASTGTAIGTYSVGLFPDAICFDGASVWVANSAGNNVTKLNAGTGATIGTYSVGSYPDAICFDGASVWVANSAGNNVTKLNAGTGATIGTYSVGTYPYAICFDGANIWVANSGNNNVTKLNAGTGAAIGTYSVGTYPYAICFDGANIWVANESGGNVTKL